MGVAGTREGSGRGGSLVSCDLCEEDYYRKSEDRAETGIALVHTAYDLAFLFLS